MTKEEYQHCLAKYAASIDQCRQMAHELHESVNQTYGDNLPYGFHLDMVAEGVRLYGYLVCAQEADVVPLFRGAGPDGCGDRVCPHQRQGAHAC